MSEKRWTPGPWEATKYGYEKWSVNSQDRMVEICGCWNHRNARLIAAAPELYEALEALVLCVRGGTPIFEARQAADKALAKADGEQP